MNQMVNMLEFLGLTQSKCWMDCSDDAAAMRFLMSQTVKMLELLRLFVNHMVKMQDFSRHARSKCWRS